MTHYQIQATATKTHAAGSITKQIPTFYLDSEVQGITNEDHAQQIARRIIDPFNLFTKVAMTVATIEIKLTKRVTSEEED